MSDFEYKTAPGAPAASLLDDLATAYQEKDALDLRRTEVEAYIDSRRAHDKYIARDTDGTYYNITELTDLETLERLLACQFVDDYQREGSSLSCGGRKAVIERRLQEVKKEAK